MLVYVAPRSEYSVFYALIPPHDLHLRAIWVAGLVLQAPPTATKVVDSRTHARDTL
jgi:hypothetical protein